MLLQATFFALALLRGSVGQIIEGFENGWNQKDWPLYTGGCNQGGKPTSFFT